jgi:hypothetical protein
MKRFQNRDNIVRVSKILRVVLFGGLIVWGLGVAIFVFDLLFPLFVLPKDKLYSSTTLIFAGLLILASLAFYVNSRLFRFFDRLKSGYLFDRKTVGFLDSAGKWWIGAWLYSDLLTFLIRHWVFQPQDLNFGGLSAGLILLFVAWLLKEAQGLQEEQELTV